MNNKYPSRKFAYCLSISALLVMGAFTCFAQEPQPKTEAEIRALIKKSRAKDLKVSDTDEAKQALSKLDAKYIPTLIRILKKGEPCERIGAAEFIIDLDRNNKDVIPELVKIAKGRSIFDSEADLICRRGATFPLAWYSEGIRILTGFLKGKDMFLRQNAMFAFYEHTEGSDFPDDSTQAWKDAIPAIVKASKDKDEILSTTAGDVLDRFIARGGEELSSATKKAMGQNK